MGLGGISGTQRGALFAEIVRCDEMVRCLDGDAVASPCASVVWTQWVGCDAAERKREWRSLHQLPEPWVGHIDRAKILFVSSNPSIGGIRSPHTAAHRNGWAVSDESMFDTFERAFETYITDGKRLDGKVVRYWACIKKRAEELIPQRRVKPGIDYAITEVVRCKSKSEQGVADAADACVERYLDRTLGVSSAVVIVGVGSHARHALRRHFGVRGESSVATVVSDGRERKLVCLPHPNARGGAKTFAGNINQTDLDELRASLTD
jgi:uracil-DNA glycosylase